MTTMAKMSKNGRDDQKTKMSNTAKKANMTRKAEMSDSTEMA